MKIFNWLFGKKKKTEQKPHINMGDRQMPGYRCPSSCNTNSDDGFVDSAIIGYATDNAIVGGLLGGNLAGGIIGDMLNSSDSSSNDIDSFNGFGGGDFGGGGSSGSWDSSSSDPGSSSSFD